MSIPLEIRCGYCKTHFIKQEYWIDPQLYTKPEKAIKKVIFYCPNSECSKAVGLELRMLPGQQVCVERNLSQTEMFDPDRVIEYTLKASSGEEEDDESTDDDLPPLFE